MTVAEARKLAPVSLVGGYQYEAKTPGLDYNFEVTPRGRIYRVTSSQPLGHFEEDRNFLTTLRTRLTAKYGQPVSAIGDSFHWSLTEPVADNEGHRLPFNTMWMSAYVSQGGDTASLEMTMIDFRILWADQTIQNRTPREMALGRLKF